MVKPLSLWLLPALLLLTACGSMTPAPTTTSSPETAPPPERDEQPRRPPPPAESESGERRAPQPGEPDRETSGEGGEGPVAGLLERGWRLYRDEDYDAALSVAERAQRIAPRDPEIYLLMARARFSQARMELAEQLVRRGLAFSPGGSPIQRQLQSLMREITAAR